LGLLCEKMSYNGVGLTTPRGSGTNGFVTRNMSLVRPRFQDPLYGTAKAAAPPRQPNEDLLDHERKRKIQLKLLTLREELEEQGYILLSQVYFVFDDLMWRGW
jgi:serine/arginine repetitive matrix protein 2